MVWNKHSELEGKHAVLSASKYHWLRYTDERLYEYVDNIHAAHIGTLKHEYAAMAIRLRAKQPNTTKTLDNYINDAIGFRMNPEVVLYATPYAFGTADAISFRDKILRIFDLKNGRSKVSETQLYVYAAYFCMEYKIRPTDIEFDLRIYQNDEIYYIEVDPVEITYIMDRTKELSQLLAKRMTEEV